MKKKILLASSILLLAGQLPTTLYAGEKDVNVVNTPDVNIVNPSIQVTGEVTSTVSGDVNATITNTVDATVSNTVDVNVTNGAIPVDIQNMIDIQSLPAIQIEPNQLVGTIPALRPGGVLAYGLTCSFGSSEFTKRCDFEGFPSNGGVLTHISITPRYANATRDTVCNVTVGAGVSLISYSWDGDTSLGTSIVLPFSVQMGAPSAVPFIFMSRSGASGGCSVGASYHGYRP